MKLRKLVTYIFVAGMVFFLTGEVGACVTSAAETEETENPGDIVENPWGDLFNDKEKPTSQDLPLDSETTTRKDNITSENEKLVTFQKAGKVKVKKVIKKKSEKKVKVTLKKVLNSADGYRLRFYKTKKYAKKNKKSIVTLEFKKNKKVFTVKNKKLKNKKTLFIRVKGYASINGKKYYSKKWSVPKKVKIK